ncbi:MAG: IucA/IucC family protein, partial [Pseudonocardiaceae bacterium]
LDNSPAGGNVLPLVVAPLAPNFAVEHGESTKTGESAGGPFSRLLLVEHPGLRQALADEGLGPGSANLIPMHPWQVHNVLGQRYGDQLRTNALRLLKATIPARPLMSYRTFAPLATTSTRHPHHIKTSLSVRLTSAIRGVSPAAAHNGPIISRLLHAVVHTEANFGGKLRVLAEPAAARFEAPGSTQSSAGLSASAALAALARANPEDELAPEELLLPTGALWANSPLSGQPILGELLDEMCAPHTPGPRPMYTRAQAADHFARGYAELVLPPILTLLTKYGIAMEAHGENTLLAIRRGRPVRYVIRDLGAIRIHPGRLAGQGLHVEPLPGSPVITNDTDELRNKLYHAQFVNDARRLVACLARLSGSPSENFWRHFRDTTRATFAALARQRPLSTAARTDAEALLTRPWPAKALLSMWLGETPNEYTYLPIANPLAYEPSHTTQGDRTG